MIGRIARLLVVLAMVVCSLWLAAGALGVLAHCPETASPCAAADLPETGTAPTEVTGAPALAVHKWADRASVRAGERLTYTLALT
ncbi:MAG: hypothetical protein JXA09_05230, partial [Anaerolineae bacterium]|nr:hypothetical protein [Anaerolineae bacterium]